MSDRPLVVGFEFPVAWILAEISDFVSVVNLDVVRAIVDDPEGGI